METALYPLQKSKGKLIYQSWLILYAIRIEKDLYVLTGGAIKLTKKMQGREQHDNTTEICFTLGSHHGGYSTRCIT